MSTPNSIKPQVRIKQVTLTLGQNARGEIFVANEKIEDTRPEKPKNPPVRNPAFREHEGLKALQKQLHEQDRNKK